MIGGGFEYLYVQACMGETVWQEKVLYLCGICGAVRYVHERTNVITPILRSYHIPMTQPLYTDIGRREDLKRRIVSRATLAFRKQGIRSVTMDDIAHMLTMSKRTLYQLFADKEELLLACVKQHVVDEGERMPRLLEAGGNDMLNLLLLTLEAKLKEAEEVNPCFVEDLVRYPRVRAFFERNNREREAEAVAFLNRGKAEGYFRKEVNFNIVYRQLMQGLDNMVAGGLLNIYSQREILANTIVPYLRGCATMEGIRIIDEFIQDKFYKSARQA